MCFDIGSYLSFLLNMIDFKIYVVSCKSHVFNGDDFGKGFMN